MHTVPSRGTSPVGARAYPRAAIMDAQGASPHAESPTAHPPHLVMDRTSSRRVEQGQQVAGGMAVAQAIRANAARGKPSPGMTRIGAHPRVREKTDARHAALGVHGRIRDTRREEDDEAQPTGGTPGHPHARQRRASCTTNQHTRAAHPRAWKEPIEVGCYGRVHPHEVETASRS